MRSRWNPAPLRLEALEDRLAPAHNLTVGGPNVENSGIIIQEDPGTNTTTIRAVADNATVSNITVLSYLHTKLIFTSASTGTQEGNITTNINAGTISTNPLNLSFRTDASATVGNIIVNEFLQVASSDGAMHVVLDAKGDIQVNLFGIDAKATGSLSLTAGGSITQSTGSFLTGSLKGGSLLLSAGSGIGSSSNALDTAVANLEATTSTGGIFVSNAGDLTVGGVSGAASGVKVTTSGDIVVTSDSKLSVTTSGDTVAGPGDITLTASGLLWVSQNVTSTATADGATISLTGNSGVAIYTGATVTNSNGKAVTIDVDGFGSASQTVGIVVDSSTLNAQGGAVSLEGTGVAGVFFGAGVFLHNGAVVEATGAGTVTILGTGGNGTQQNFGLWVLNATIRTADGDLTVQGTANGSADANYGVVTTNALLEATGTGKISITGTGADGTSFNDGVVLQGATQVVTAGGDLSITGTGKGTISGGITFDKAPTISAGSSGLVTLKGTGTLPTIGLWFFLGGSITGQTVDIDAGGIAQSSGSINATNLRVRGTGTFSLLGTNAVGTVAADVNGAFSLVNSTGLTVGTVLGTAGITTSDNDVILTASTGEIRVGTINAGAAGDVTITATTGDIFDDSSSLTRITGDVVTLTAFRSIGSGFDEMETKANSLVAETTGPGPFDLAPGIFVNEWDALVVTSATTKDGNIIIYAASDFAGNLTVGTVNAGGWGRRATLGTVIGTTSNVDFGTSGSVTSSGNAVQISSSGGITESGSASKVITSSFSFRTGTGVGLATDPLNVQVDNLAGINNTSGGIAIADPDGFTVTRLVTPIGVFSGLTANGQAIVLTATSGTITVDQAISATGGGSVTLNAGQSIQVNASIAGGSGDMTLIADEMDFAAGSSITGTGNLFLKPHTLSRAISLGAASNQPGKLSLTATDLAALGSTFYQVVIGSPQATGLISVDGNATLVTSVLLLQNIGSGAAGIALNDTLDVGTGNMGLVTQGGITSTASGLLKANYLTLQAESGIGTSSNLVLTQVNKLEATTSTGGIFISNTGALTIGGVFGTLDGVKVVTSGDVSLTADSLTLDESVTTPLGNVLLTATTGTLTGGTVMAPTAILTAATGIASSSSPLLTQVSNLEAETATGGIFVRNTGALTIGGGSATLNGVKVVTSGDVSLTANSLTLDESVSTASGNVTLVANTGTLIGGTVEAGTVDLTAVTGIDVETRGTTLKARTTGAGAVRIDEFDGVTLESITAANGAITINTGGATIVTSVVSTTNDDANDITLKASSGDITITTIHAGSLGEVNIEATAGNIFDDEVDATGITADGLTLTAVRAIGNSGSLGGIDTTVNSLTASTTGDGPFFGAPTPGIFVSDSDALAVTSATTKYGFVILSAATSAAGNLTVGTVTAGGVGIIAELRTWTGSNSNVDFGSTGIVRGETVRLESSGAVTESGSASKVIAPSLSVLATTGIGSATDALNVEVNNLAGENSSSGGMAIADPDGFTVTQIGSIAGLTANGQAISLTALSGTITVDEAISATGGGSVTLNAGQSIVVNASIVGSSGDMTLTADEMDFASGSSITGTGYLFLEPQTTSRDISLGGANNQAGKLSLTATDLAALGSTFFQVVIGTPLATGLISVDGNVTLTTSALLLQNTGNGAAGIAVNATLDVGTGNMVIVTQGGMTSAATGLLKANNLTLQAETGVGTSSNPILTQVNNLQAETNTGGIYIHNTGALVIGGTSAFLAGLQTAASGDIEVSASSPLTLWANVLATGGNITLTAEDSAATGDDLTVKPLIQINANGGNILLQAGDDVFIDSSATVKTTGTGTIVIEVDAGDADAGVGGTATVWGNSLNAPGGATLQGGGDADTFHLSPSEFTAITVEGDAPQTSPGDTANIDVNLLATGSLNITDRFSSTLSWTGMANVATDSIENLNIQNGTVNVLLDLAVATLDGQPFLDGGSSSDAVEMGLNPALTDLVFQVGRNGAALTDYFSIGKGGVAATSLLGSSDDETITVRNTVGPTEIRTQGGNDSIRVAPTAGGLRTGLAGALQIDAGPGTNRLTVDDSTNSLASTVNLKASRIEGTGYGIDYVATGGTFQAVNFQGGRGADTVNYFDRTGSTMLVNSGGGNDRIQVRIAPTTLLNGLTVNGGSGGNTLTLQNITGIAIVRNVRTGPGRGVIRSSFLGQPTQQFNYQNIAQVNGINAQANYIQSLYQHILGRSANAQSVAYWQRVLVTQGRLAVVRALELSPAGRAHLVNQWFRLFRGGPPVGTQATPYVRALLAGQSEETVLGRLLGNAQAPWRAAVRAKLVTYYYQYLLGRNPSARELAQAVQSLNGIGQIRMLMEVSNEFFARGT